MPENSRVRAAKVEDSEVIAALCFTVWIDTYCISGIEVAHANYVLAEYTAQRVIERIRTRAVFVAEVDSTIVGVAVLNNESGEIETLYVLPKFKGIGVGTLLITTLKNKSTDRLFLTCWEGNEAALAFYRKQGFNESGQAFFELDGKKIRNIVLRCS